MIKLEELKEYVNFEEKKIIIKYDEIFNRPSISHLNNYDIKVRKYYGILNLISRDLNIILNNYIEYAIVLLNFKVNNKKKFNEIIENKENYCDEDYQEMDKKFIQDIKEVYNDSKLISIINEYIDSTYDIDLDNIDGNRKINIDLQITNKINKAILKSSVMIRIISPIVCDYINNSFSNNKNLFITINRDILKSFSDGNENTLNKIHKIVSSRVYQTQYSDSVIWNYFKLLSIDPNTLKIEIYKNVLDGIISKIDINTSCVKYLDVVIRQKIQFKFRYNFPISYKALKRGRNDDEIDDNDKMESLLFISNIDEGTAIINNMTIKQQISKYNFSEEEINDFKNNILNNKNINEIQDYFIQTYFGNKFNYNNCNYSQKVVLLMGLIEELSNKGFVYIPMILRNNINRDSYIINKRKLSNKVFDSIEFKNLINKFSQVSDIFLKDNPISKINSFKNYRFINDIESELDSDGFSFEIIKFLNLI